MKDYEYKGFTYYYNRHLKMWVIITEFEFIYECSKKDVITSIDYLVNEEIPKQQCEERV